MNMAGDTEKREPILIAEKNYPFESVINSDVILLNAEGM